MESSSSHSGPSHHRLWRRRSLGISPLEAQSAGFSAVGTCLQVCGEVACRMKETLLDTKTLKSLGWPSSQDSTMLLSVQAWTCSSGTSRAVFTSMRSSVRSTAPHNSCLGTVEGLSLATLVLEMTRDSIGGCCW